MELIVLTLHLSPKCELDSFLIALRFSVVLRMISVRYFICVHEIFFLLDYNKHVLFGNKISIMGYNY